MRAGRPRRPYDDESITERIQKDMTAAMKARDADTLSTLRMLKAALMEARTKKPKDAVFSHDEEIEWSSATPRSAARPSRS